MPDAAGLLGFVIAGVLLNLTPGVDMVYILAEATRRGLRAGVIATAGVCAGCSVHIAAAVFGVSTLLATSTSAFLMLKIAGALYLFYLGTRAWLSTFRSTPGSPLRSTPGSPLRSTSRPPPGPTPRPTPGLAAVPACAAPPASTGIPAAAPATSRQIFMTGFLTNALNPKVALFFLAFLPQFIRPGTVDGGRVMLLLGALFIVNSFVVNLLLAAAAVRLADRFGRRPGLGRWLQRLTGTLFIGFGLRLLVARSPAG